MKRIGLAGLVFVVLLFGVQVVSAEGWPGCPWGEAYNPAHQGFVSACLSRPASPVDVAAKPAGLAATVAKATPFKGSWEATETATFEPAPPPAAETMYVDLDAWGNATQLGKYTAHFVATVDVAGCGCSVGDTIAFTAANGDSLYGVGSAVGVPPPDKPGFHEVTHIMAITGGTGRFAGATGRFTVVRLVNLATGESTGSFNGTIALAAGK